MANDLPFAASHALDGLAKALANVQAQTNDHSHAEESIQNEIDLHDVAQPPPPPPLALDHGPTNEVAIQSLFDHNHDHWFV